MKKVTINIKNLDNPTVATDLIIVWMGAEAKPR